MIDVARRNQCQACRFRKCLACNMRREGKSRFDFNVINLISRLWLRLKCVLSTQRPALNAFFIAVYSFFFHRASFRTGSSSTFRFGVVCLTFLQCAESDHFQITFDFFNQTRSISQQMHLTHVTVSGRFLILAFFANTFLSSVCVQKSVFRTVWVAFCAILGSTLFSLFHCKT